LKVFFKKLFYGKGLPWRAVRFGVLFAVGLGLSFMWFEKKFIYFPVRYPEGLWNPPEPIAAEGQVAAHVEDCWLTTSDGLKLHGWFCTPRRKTSKAWQPVPAEITLLWFHGNGGNLSHRYEMIQTLIPIPVNALILDYRGYGRSEGRPGERGLYEDARTAWNFLTRERNIAPDRIVLLGNSLGGAIAIHLATEVKPAGLIVQSSFTSIPEMASEVMPFVPRFLIRTRMNSIDRVPSIRCPKLFIHSPADDVVPYTLGRRLFEAAAEPKQFYKVENARHNETYIVGGQVYFQTIQRFVLACRPTQQPSS